MDGHAVYGWLWMSSFVAAGASRASARRPLHRHQSIMSSIMQPSTASGYPRVPVVHQDCTVQVFCFRMVRWSIREQRSRQPSTRHDDHRHSSSVLTRPEREAKDQAKERKGQTLTLPPCRVLLLRDGLAPVPPSVATSLQARMPTWVFHQNQ